MTFRAVEAEIQEATMNSARQGTDSQPSHQLLAGVAKVDITDYDAGAANDPLYAKALVLRNDATEVVIVTVDAVALEEIGPIRGNYLSNVRTALQQDLGIQPTDVLINASHCHGIVSSETDLRTVQAVKEARQNMAPVAIHVGRGHEDRIMENRRLRLKNGSEADVRHAYSLPSDAEVVAVGPVDPEIGILQLKREDGRTLAVVYNFACHPIQGVPGGGSTADIVGFASKVIEDNLSDGTIALFLQGCAGDINPVWYKDVDHPRDAEPLGNLLGLSVLQALRKARRAEDTQLRVACEAIELPRADLAPYIDSLQSKQSRLLESLKGTTLNLKTFLSLAVKHGLSPDFPSYYSHRYLHDNMMGRGDLDRLDAENRRNMAAYIENIHIMEQLTRVQENLSLLKMHHAQNVAAGKTRTLESNTLDAEVMGLRIGEFVLVTFPGELSVQIGLNVKQRSPHEFTFVAGYTNGYIYYAPTAEQLQNRGGAQEDSDCLLAPEWQRLFEEKAAAMLMNL